MYARLGSALLALSLVFVFSAGTVTSTKATGATGPIQLGGDDANDHGESDWLDHDSDVATPDVVTVIDGWKYIEVSLKEMLATEQRANATNSIAVIGTDGSSAYVTGEGWTENDGGVSCVNDGSTDTYCMMEVIRAELDRLNGATAAPTVTYYETAAEVTAFFNALTAGTTNVAVVFIPGDDGDNDLEDGATDDDTVNNDPLVTTPMEQALIDSASDIATFNAQGGGLLSSGSDHYLSWLSVLIPTIGISDDPTSSDIGMTADGAALWVGLFDQDIYAPWHNHFTGSLGALKVLGLGFDNWTDTNTNKMIDAGEADRLNWEAGPDAISGTADDLQTVVIIGGAAGEAAIGEELPPTNTSGDASASWALLVAALVAVAGLALRVVERKRLQA